MMADLYVLFNHRLTKEQQELARDQLGIQSITTPPVAVSRT